MIGPDEAKRHGSVGRLAEKMEAKIVDPVTGEALSPGQKGELWLRGPTIMKGHYLFPFFTDHRYYRSRAILLTFFIHNTRLELLSFFRRIRHVPLSISLFLLIFLRIH